MHFEIMIFFNLVKMVKKKDGQVLQIKFSNEKIKITLKMGKQRFSTHSYQ